VITYTTSWVGMGHVNGAESSTDLIEDQSINTCNLQWSVTTDHPGLLAVDCEDLNHLICVMCTN